MWIKKFLKLILIIFSGFSSLLLLFTISTYFYFFNKNNIYFIDTKGYLSTFISWYIDKEIKLKTISFKNNDNNSKYNISISDFESSDYKNFSEIKVGLISFECHFIECLRNYKNFSNINLINPNMKITFSKNENNSGSYYEDLINFIDKAEITKIKDGVISIHYSEIINEFSNINLIKKDNNNGLSVLGNFSYRSNKYDNKSNFNIGIYKNEFKSLINLKFSSFSFPQLISKRYDFLPFLITDYLIDGDVSLNIKNGFAEKFDFKIFSDKGNVILKNNNLKNFLLKDKYIFKNLNLSGNYNFKNQLLEFKKFDISINEQDSLNTRILVNGFSDLEFKKTNLIVNIDFNNFIPKNIILFEENKYDDFLINKYSGTSSFKIVDSKFLNLVSKINDVSLNELSIKNILLTKQNLFSENELKFEIEGKYENLLFYFDKYSIFNQNYLNKINGDLYSNVKFIIPNSYSSIVETKFEIKGSVKNVMFINNKTKLLIDVEDIKSFNFDIDNFNENEYINLNKLELNFYSKNRNLNSFINLQGTYKFFENKHNINSNIDFQNLTIKNISEYIPNFLNINSFNLITGQSNIIIKDSHIKDISLNLENFYFDKVFIHNINFMNKSISNYMKINFQINSDIEYLIDMFDKEYIKENNNLYYLNNLRGILESNIEIIIDNFEVLDIKVAGKIESILNKDKSNFINNININFIDKLDFNYRDNESKTTFNGVASIYDSKFNFNYIKNNTKNLFNMSFVINDKIREILNYNQNIVKGDSEYNIKIFKDNNVWNYDAEINFLSSTIDISSINYEKFYDKFSNLYIYGNFSNNFLLENINFKYKDLNNIVYGKVKNLKDNDLFIDIEKFVFDKNNFAAEIKYDLDNNFVISIKNGILNLDTFFKSESKSNKNFFITANLDKLFLFNNLELNKTKLIYNYQKGLLNEFSIYSKYYGDEDFNLICFNEGNNPNRNKYELVASDAGKFFKTLNYTTEIMGGVFSSEGYFGEIDDDYDIMGTVSIDNFRVMKAPIFAELLLAASLTGLIEVLENDGIEFEQFDAQYFGKNDIYTITKSRAYGFSLGITGEGSINSKNSIVDIKGSLIPAYKINSVFNNIPIIGEIVSGKEDEGLFAINYYTKGNWNNLESEINPLSALTPGLLRNIFDFLE